MNGIVVYQSKWGNSRQIAEAIVKGLEDSGHRADLMRVTDARGLATDHEFVVLGGPTRIARAYGPIKRFARGELKTGWEGKPFATFSTGAAVGTEKANKQASEWLYEMLEANGLKPLTPPFKAAVRDMHGPLADGEVKRAEEFGKELGATLWKLEEPPADGITASEETTD